jgi:erythromycin esterase-like protein
MKAEQERFYRGLRHAAAGRPLAYYGFDIDALPGGGYKDIAESLAPFATLPKVRAFQASLAPVAGESAAREAIRLAALAPVAAALDSDIGDASREVEIAVRAMAESLTYVEGTYPAQTYDALAPGMAFREGCMKRRFADLLQLTNAARTVVMGHALHLAKDDRLLGKAVGLGPGGGIECSIGHHLLKILGLKAMSIWMIQGGGEDSQPFADLPRRFNYPSTTLNTMLRDSQTPVLFRIADAPPGLFNKPIGIGHMYNNVQATVLAGQVDAILYLPKVSPIRATQFPG